MPRQPATIVIQLHWDHRIQPSRFLSTLSLYYALFCRIRVQYYQTALVVVCSIASERISAEPGFQTSVLQDHLVASWHTRKSLHMTTCCHKWHFLWTIAGAPRVCHRLPDGRECSRRAPVSALHVAVCLLQAVKERTQRAEQSSYLVPFFVRSSQPSLRGGPLSPWNETSPFSRDTNPFLAAGAQIVPPRAHSLRPSLSQAKH